MDSYFYNQDTTNTKVQVQGTSIFFPLSEKNTKARAREASMFFPFSDKNQIYYSKIISLRNDYDSKDYPKSYSKAFEITESLKIFEKGILSFFVFIMSNLEIYLKNSEIIPDIKFISYDENVADAEIYEVETIQAIEKLIVFSSEFENTENNEDFETIVCSLIECIQEINIFQSEYFGKAPSFELGIEDINDPRFDYLENDRVKLIEILSLFTEMLESSTRCSTFGCCFDNEC